MKQRVTLFLEKEAAKMLRVIAAGEDKSQSDIVEELLYGTREHITDPKEIEKIEEEFDIESDQTKAEVLQEPICELELIDSTPGVHCESIATQEWTTPNDWTIAGKIFKVCETHYKQLTSQ